MADEPRWLDAAEMRAWRGFVEGWRLVHTQLERALATRSSLSLTDYEVLVRLSETPDRRLRMTELAAATLASKSRLSHQVTRMEHAGLVRRESCPTDRRGAFAVLTDDGFDALVAAAPGHVGDVREFLLDRLSREQVIQLGEISAVLRDYAAAGGVTCPDAEVASAATTATDVPAPGGTSPTSVAC